ncbi:MAG: hypothetical protein Q9173_007035 [Seirophora scorigena]
MVRKFDRLGARVILLTQHKIARLEEELQAEDVKCTAEQGDNGTIDGDPRLRRLEIMEEVLWRSEHYQQGDLMPVISREKPPLCRLIDRYDILSRFSWWRVKKENLNPRHYNHKDNYASHTTIYSDEPRMDKFVTCVTIVLGLMMLVAPLQYVSAIKPDPVASRIRWRA